MRAVLLGLLLAGAAWGEVDALRTWRHERRRLESEEKKFWRAFQGRFSQALITFRREIEKADAQPDQHKEATWDYSDFRMLYNEYAGLQEALGKADLALAESGHRKAAPTLLKELRSLLKEAGRLEDELAQAKPKTRYYVFDQRLGIHRHGLGVRRALLVQALSRCPDAAAVLSTEGWKRAEREDGRRSISRRVAMLDALTLTGDERARPVLESQLKSESSSLRIAALEGLIRFGAPAREPLEPLLYDPSPVVQRALLQEIRARAAGDPRWIRPVLVAFRESEGLVRHEALGALEALTKQRFGYSLKRWVTWFEVYEKEIESGKFRADQVEVQDAEPEPPAETVSFYGVETPSLGVAFVIEGSQSMWLPADWEVQRTRYRDLWPGVRRQWEKTHPSHQEILLREFDACLESFPEKARFGMVTLHSLFSWSLEGERRLLGPTSRDVRKARELLERLPGRGWCSQFQGIRLAAALGGLDPETDVDFEEPRIDTVFLLGSGDPAGGRYMTPEAVLAAFKRFNRFRRLVVHALRICNRKEPAETVMKGLAEVSGGRYVWLKKPPA